jgi:hypothetical protein
MGCSAWVAIALCAVDRQPAADDCGSLHLTSPTVPAAELPAVYRAIVDRLRREAADPSKAPELRDQILKAPRRFDDLAEPPASTRRRFEQDR